MAAPSTAGNDNVIALIDRYAAANNIPAAFARAVVRVESNFNPRATGRAREVGLMQIKFETARGIGFTGTREQLYDPATNLEWGMKYLAMSWKLGGNTPCGAVMKYQGGHGTDAAVCCIQRLLQQGSRAYGVELSLAKSFTMKWRGLQSPRHFS